MRFSIWLAALAPFALAAPTYDEWKPAKAHDARAVSSYFKSLVRCVGESRVAGVAGVASACDLSKAVMPVATTPLPAPAEGLVLRHVAIGRGTQNYTCDTSNATAVPFANGAVATLYNASCLAATQPTVLSTMTNFALQYDLPTAIVLPSHGTPNPANLLISGAHFFTPDVVPFFTLDSDAAQIGTILCKKDATIPAPADASPGQGGLGLGAVPWLKLSAKDSTGNLQEVYRLNTAGGAAPKTCTGMPAAFEVQYAAEYWFYAN